MINQVPFVTDVDSALDRYVARAPLYLGSAAVVAAAGSAIIFFGQLTPDEACMLSVALIAPLHGIVAIGTSAGTSDEALPARTIIARALRKWPELLVCQILTILIASITIHALFDNDWSWTIALVPLSIAWGAISLSDVIVAIDEPAQARGFFESLVRRVQFLGSAIVTSLGYAFQIRTLSRLASLSVIQLPCIMLQLFVLHQAQMRHVALNEAWVALLISCLADGLYETIFTQTLQRLRAA